MSPDLNPENERITRRFRAEEKFRLLGHDCPLGRYPAPVVPIGTMGDRLVAVHRLYGDPKYPQIVGTSYAPVAEDAEFVHYSRELLARLESFDPLREELFAESPEVVFPYRSLRAISEISAVRRADPFVRLSVAAGGGDPRETTVELTACVQFILDTEPGMADDWYRNMTRELTGRGYHFPPTWRELFDIRESPPDLRGWEAISQHLAVSVRTAQLWAERETLPLHRTRSGEVYCNIGELDAWLQSGRPALRWYDEHVLNRTRSMFSYILEHLRSSYRPLIITVVISTIFGLLSTEAIRWYQSRVVLQLQSPSTANLVRFDEAASAPIKSRFSYTVTITNESSRAAQNVELLVQAPIGLQLNPVRPDAHVSDRPGDTANARIVRVSQLDAGQSLTLQYEGSGRDRYVPQSQLQVTQVLYRPFRSQ